MKIPGTILLFLAGLVASGQLVAGELDAILHWYQKAPLSTPVSGVITAVAVDVGDTVNKGDVLIQLDDRLRRARVAALEAALKAAENARDEAQRELDRTQELYDQTLLAVHDLQMSEIQRDAAEAEYQQARAAQIQAVLDLEYSTILAPFAGVVVKRQATIGQSINADLQVEPLIELAESTRMVARVKVSAKQSAALTMGQQVQVRTNGKTFTGKVIRSGLDPVEPDVDQYQVDILFETGGQLFRVGQSARVVF